MSDWKKCLATHEEKQTLSTGDWLGDKFPGVALPSTKALRKWVEIRYNGRWTCAQVMDVGPWCIDDDQYVFGNEKARASGCKGKFCPRVMTDLVIEYHEMKCNGAGIDLFPETAKNLGIALNDNVVLEWRFLEPGI